MTGFLMEKPVAVLRRDLNALGIVRDDGVRKTEDHIAALCNAEAERALKTLLDDGG